ncbi:hypothetical protein [Streptomyces sp. NPDC087297]|uniref:hypothetical protein n=1 Tax=Streptomyces sp. NPDC087297 TaxID=3365778 RepID=UPI003826A81B
MTSPRRLAALAALALAAVTVLTGPAAADDTKEERVVPAFTVDPVGKAPLSCALGLPGVGVPCGSTGPMTSGTDTVGTVYRQCTLQKQGAKYNRSQCELVFEFDNGAQIGVRALVPVPRTGVEPKAFEGFVTGGTLKYAGLTGAVHYEPVTGRAGQYAVTFH